jgi:hypothetical protein
MKSPCAHFKTGVGTLNIKAVEKIEIVSPK